MTARDAGAQPERTRLAWRRTVLAATVLVLLAIRGVVTTGVGAFEMTVLALLAVLWLAILAGSHIRMRALAAARPPSLRRRWAVLTVIAAVALAALAALTLP